MVKQTSGCLCGLLKTSPDQRKTSPVGHQTGKNRSRSFQVNDDLLSVADFEEKEDRVVMPSAGFFVFLELRLED